MSVPRPPTLREGAGNGVHLVLQHLGVEGSDVEGLHSVGKTASEHGVHVDTSACGVNMGCIMKVNVLLCLATAHLPLALPVECHSLSCSHMLQMSTSGPYSLWPSSSGAA